MSSSAPSHSIFASNHHRKLLFLIFFPPNISFACSRISYKLNHTTWTLVQDFLCSAWLICFIHVVQLLTCVHLFVTPGTAELPCPSPSPWVCTNLCRLSWWCHPTISFSIILFSSCPQSLPALGCFPMSWLFTSGRQSLCESESHSVVSNSLRPHGLYSPWNSPGRNTGVGSLSLLQGIFPTQVSCIAGRFFSSWATREAQEYWSG